MERPGENVGSDEHIGLIFGDHTFGVSRKFTNEDRFRRPPQILPNEDGRLPGIVCRRLYKPPSQRERERERE